MKFIDWLSKFEFTTTGGYAVYFLMCVAYVTILGAWGIGTWVVRVIVDGLRIFLQKG